jgi:hypothetical protein
MFARTVSRVLSSVPKALEAIIPLWRRLLDAFSGLTREFTDLSEIITPLFDLAPGRVCRCRFCHQKRGELLPHRFALTGSLVIKPKPTGGFFSVALSVKKPSPASFLAVSQYLA